MNELIESVERRQLRKLPGFKVGDRVRVHFQVVEGSRRRTQVFEGVVLKQQGSGVGRTFTVRKLSFGVGVERTFPLHSPKIERVEIVARGEVRRAKLYYLRGRIGRRARVRERRDVDLAELGALDADGRPLEEGAEGSAEEGAEEHAEQETEAEAAKPDVEVSEPGSEVAENEEPAPERVEPAVSDDEPGGADSEPAGEAEGEEED